MQLDLSPEDVRVRDHARSFAKEVLAPRARTADEEGVFDPRVVQELGDAGILGGPLPRDVGGRGWTHLQWALVQAELGAVDSSWRGFATVQTSLCGLLLLHAGSAAQRAELLPALASGALTFAFALTEPEAGTDVAAIQCHARADGDSFLVDGTKWWITNGGVADRILLFATVDPALGRKGLTCLCIPGDLPGMRREPMAGKELGHRASNHARLVFEGARVPASAVVGEVGSGLEVAKAGLAHGRLGVAAGAVGIQAACLEACLEFSRTRRQFGRRIGDFQLIQQVLCELHVNLESARWHTWRAAWLRDQGRANDLEVAVAKYTACEGAVRAGDQAVLLHGARGYSSEYPVERYFRDAKGLQIYEGTSHIQQVIIAKNLLGKDPMAPK